MWLPQSLVKANADRRRHCSTFSHALDRRRHSAPTSSDTLRERKRSWRLTPLLWLAAGGQLKRSWLHLSRPIEGHHSAFWRDSFVLPDLPPSARSMAKLIAALEALSASVCVWHTLVSSALGGWSLVSIYVCSCCYGLFILNFLIIDLLAWQLMASYTYIYITRT